MDSDKSTKRKVGWIRELPRQGVFVVRIPLLRRPCNPPPSMLGDAGYQVGQAEPLMQVYPPSSRERGELSEFLTNYLKIQLSQLFEKHEELRFSDLTR